MADEDKRDVTRERVLDVAEALFAEKGYHAVSVREITSKAGSNIAAINYHFGNKKNLYVEVFRSRWLPRAYRLQEVFRRSLADRENITSAEVIEALARAFIEGHMSDQERVRHAQLMIREMARPTEALDLLGKEVMVPFFRELAGLLRRDMPEGIEEERLMLNILSIFAVVIYFNFARPPVSLMTGRGYDRGFRARLVEHIKEFALGGLKAFQKEGVR